MAAIIGQLIIGWLIADLISGIFHWWEDRVGREDMWFIGPRVITFNRIHHRNPGASLLGGFWHRNRDPMLLALVVALAWLAIAGFSLVWLSASLGGMIATQVHYWAHHPPASPLIRALQDTGLIQSPKHHSQHHGGDQDQRYCVLTNLINPVLDVFGVWHGIEAAMTKIGLEPNRGTA